MFSRYRSPPLRNTAFANHRSYHTTDDSHLLNMPENHRVSRIPESTTDRPTSQLTDQSSGSQSEHTSPTLVGSLASTRSPSLPHTTPAPTYQSRQALNGLDGHSQSYGALSLSSAARHQGLNNLRTTPTSVGFTETDIRANGETSSRAPVQPRAGSGRGQSRNFRLPGNPTRRSAQYGRHRGKGSHPRSSLVSYPRYEVRIGEGTGATPVSDYLGLKIHVQRDSNESVFHEPSFQSHWELQRWTSLPDGRRSTLHPIRDTESLIQNGSPAQIYPVLPVIPNSLVTLERMEPGLDIIPQQASAQGSPPRTLNPNSRVFVPHAHANAPTNAELEAAAEEEARSYVPLGLLDDSAPTPAPSSIISFGNLPSRDAQLIRWLIEKNERVRDSIIELDLPQAGNSPDYFLNLVKRHRGRSAWVSFPVIPGSPSGSPIAPTRQGQYEWEPKCRQYGSGTLFSDLYNGVQRMLRGPGSLNRLAIEVCPALALMDGHAELAPQQPGEPTIPDQIEDSSQMAGPSQANPHAIVEEDPLFSLTVVEGP